LPFRAARRRENIRREVSIFILLIIFLIFCLSYYGIILDKKTEKIKMQIAAIEKEITLYKAKADRVTEIEKIIKIYKRKVDIIQSLKNRRREAITLLDSMTGLVVPERMWLTFLHGNDRTVTIKGLAFDQKTVADFMTRLGDSPLFEKDIKLNNLKMATIGKEKTVLKEFELFCFKTTSQIEKNLAK
jgi:type IV pilus assembly protein PilN